MTICTEKEAAEKWCPMYRVSMALSDARGSEWVDNRGIAPPENAHNCIGSRCMAWRWHDYGIKREGKIEDGGYCGAFGKVEP